MDSIVNQINDPSASWLSDAFVERERELVQLRDCLHKAANGSGAFIVISGEAGTGKSTLVRQFASEAVKAGFDFIYECFDQIRSYAPYAPFLRVIARFGGSNLKKPCYYLSDNNDDTSPNGSQHKEHELCGMESLHTLQTEHGLAQQRLVLALLNAAREKPLLIALGDVHLALPTAWQFIHYLSKSISDHRILIIVTLRQDGRELQQTKAPAYADVLQRMNREGLVERIQLSRLAEEGIRRFLRKTFHRTDFSSQMAPLLHEISGGLFDQLIKCLRLMVQNGVIFQQDGIWFNQENISKAMIVNWVGHKYELQAFSEQAKDLSSTQQILLQYAALLNESFDHVILSEITNIPRQTVVKELPLLQERKILTDLAKGCYQFKRPALGSVFLEQLPPHRRPSMHHKIALAIEKATHLDPAEKVCRLAYHYSQTDDKSSACRYLRLAGDCAIGNFAFPEARELYKQALSLFSFVPQVRQNAEAVPLLLKAAWLDRALGYWEDSIRHCNEALKFCETDTEFPSKNQILIQKGLTYFRLNDWQKAMACFEQCLANKQNTSRFDLAMVNFGMGNIHFELADYMESRLYYQEALKLARELDAKLLMANIFNNLGAIENVSGHRPRAVAMYSKSIPLYESLGDNLGLARIYHNIGMTYADEGNWEQANQFYGMSLRVSDVMGLIPLKSITFLNRALALTYLRRFAEAREYNFKARRLLQQLKDELGLAEYHKIQAIIEREQSNWSAAQEHFDLALKKFNALNNRLGHAETEYERALWALAKDDHDDVLFWFGKALKSFRDLGLSEKVKVIERQLEASRSAKPPSSKNV